MKRWCLVSGQRSRSREHANSKRACIDLLYDVLEQYGLKVCLVNARNMKNVPGRAHRLARMPMDKNRIQSDCCEPRSGRTAQWSPYGR